MRGGELGYQKPPRHLILGGVPGIGIHSLFHSPLVILGKLANIQALGKSYAGSFLLFDWLATKQVTACQPYWIHMQGYFLFAESGVSFVASRALTDDKELQKDSDIWAIVHEEPISEFGAFAERDWVVIWSASPARLRQSRWRKESKAEVMTMSPWKWGELAFLRYVHLC